jgi:glutamate synthase (NADPH/NADH) small chain
MGKPTAFLEITRELPKKRPVEERVRDYREVHLPLVGEALAAQASRCMDCGVPFCHDACPLGNLIPEWNDLAYRGHMDEAASRLLATNNFPEITGRLCPAPCEAACVLAIEGVPVTIKEIERSTADHSFATGGLAPRLPEKRSGRSVAVIGSGPAGLACAQELARAGHGVTVFEQSDRIGGLLRYGIPDFKLDRGILDARLGQLAAEGVTFRTGVRVGQDVTAAELRAEFDAVALAVGAQAPRAFSVPGSELAGVHLALDYLEQENRVQAGDALDAATRIDAHGKHVIILGGGDTGADCLGVAHRQGARSVTQLEIAERPPERRGASDPWPLWPRIFRVSPAHEEGGAREFALETVRLEPTSEGAARVARLVARHVREDGGRFVPAGGDDAFFDADLVLVATGYVGPVPSPLYAGLGLVVDARGRIVADSPEKEAAPGVFVLGDARRGASLIVWAIAEGRRAAAAIDAFLARRDEAPLSATIT